MKNYDWKDESRDMKGKVSATVAHSNPHSYPCSKNA